jgi:Fe-Mn family superoxide dismutase
MIDEHSGNVSVGFYPLIVVDMWEHAYYRDYLTDKKSYLISQMREFNWNVIEERIKKAEGIAQVVK